MSGAHLNALSSVFQSIFAPFLTLELGFMGLHKYFPKVCHCFGTDNVSCKEVLMMIVDDNDMQTIVGISDLARDAV